MILRLSFYLFMSLDVDVVCALVFVFSFFFNDTATTEIYTLSLHDALPICARLPPCACPCAGRTELPPRSEEHTSELQSRSELVCRLLLEKKKQKKTKQAPSTKKKTDETNTTTYKSE